MNKIFLKVLPLFVFILFFTLTVSAADFSLTKIGLLDTSGKSYPEWWYTGTNPTLAGTAENGSEVTVKIGDTTNTTTADGSGNWSYPTSLEAKDYNVVISQGGSQISFVLHAGQSFQPTQETTTPQTTTSGTTVPETGFNQVVAISLTLGVTLLATYLYISTDNSKKAIFEKKFIEE